MRHSRIVGLLIFAIAVAVVPARAGQTNNGDAQTRVTQSGPEGPPLQDPTAASTQTYYTEAGVTPWRRVVTRTTSPGGALIIETELAPGIEGRFETVRETNTETVRISPNATSATIERFGVGLQHQRKLLEVTTSDQAQVMADGTQTVTQTWLADVNGRLGLLSRSIEEQYSSAGTSTTDTNVFVPDINQGVREAIRTTETGRGIGSADEVRERSAAVRDANGQWQAIETRTVETNGLLDSDRVEEETINRRDLNDTLGISEKIITRRSGSNGREDVLIERYVPRDPAAVHRSESRIDLQERIRQTTTVGADGSRETVEEVEARNPVAAGDPLRLRRRIVTSVQQVAPDRWVTERQIFDLDPNGRLVPSITERSEGPRP